MKKLRTDRALVLFIIIYIVSVIIAFGLGRYPVGPVELVKILFSRILPIEQTWPDQAETVVFKIRLPRLILSTVIGASLSLSGLVLQQVFRNPMASQDVLGTASGAAFGASLALLLDLSYLSISLIAFSTGILAVLMVILISRRMKHNQTLGLILGGIMTSSLFSSGTSFVKLVADTDNELPAITYWLMGSLSSSRSSDLWLVVTVTALASLPLILLSWRINLLSLSDEEAGSLGVNTKQLRLIVIICSTMLTAAAVAVSGQIGWIGLVIPHFTRMIVGNNTKKTIPLAMVLGASFLTVVDTLSRILTTSEIPLGILTSFVGAPFFLFLLSRGGRKNED